MVKNISSKDKAKSQGKEKEKKTEKD